MSLTAETNADQPPAERTSAGPWGFWNRGRGACCGRKLLNTFPVPSALSRRLASSFEGTRRPASVQLDMADDLLDHAADMLADHRATSAQLRFLLARMAEALTDVHRIAESRGAR